MRWCYFVVPHIGGTFTVYRRLREGLAKHGIDVRWMAAGPEAHRALMSPNVGDEAAHGCVVGPPLADERTLAAAMLDRLKEERYDGVFVNVLTDPVSTNLIRHLPTSIRRVLIVHNITPGTYAAASAIRNHVDATVGVSHRIRDDLIGRYGFVPSRTGVVFNAPILPDPMPPRTRSPDGRLRTLFLGRIEDESKGVLWLPAILRMAGSGVTLSVAGNGPDLERLRRLCAPLRDRVVFLGELSRDEVPDWLARHDVLIMPSRFEGSPLVLVEAMAMGCVPVASRLHGVTDAIVEDRHDGVLFPVGALDAAAAGLAMLARDPDLLARMSRNTRKSAVERFDPHMMVGQYARILRRVMADPLPKPPPLPLAQWDLPSGLRPSLRTLLPRPVKNLGRLILERMR